MVDTEDECGVCPCMQEKGADPDILETLTEDTEVLGRLQLRVQERPKVSSYDSAERKLACSSTTGKKLENWFCLIARRAPSLSS